MQKHALLGIAVKCLPSKQTRLVVGPEHYWIKYGVPGQYACYREAEDFLTISVHNCPELIDDPATLAHLIAGIEEIREERQGLDCNKKFVPGAFASALGTVPLWGSTNHWIMIGIPNPSDDGFEDFKRFILDKWNRQNAPGHREFFESELWKHGFRER
jgi:hypothetical protein